MHPVCRSKLPNQPNPTNLANLPSERPATKSHAQFFKKREMLLETFGTIDVEVVAVERYDDADDVCKPPDASQRFRYMVSNKCSGGRRSDTQWLDTSEMDDDERSLLFFLAETKHLVHNLSLIHI